MSWIIHKIHRKTPVLKSSLLKLHALRTVTLLKRDSNTGYFLWNLRNFWEHFQWLLLTVSGFQLATLLKKKLKKDIFMWILQNFWEYLLREHLEMTASWVYLWILRGFQSTSGKLLISCTSCSFSTTRHNKKIFHRCFSRPGSCHSKAFIYLKCFENCLWRI